MNKEFKIKEKESIAEILSAYENKGMTSDWMRSRWAEHNVRFSQTDTREVNKDERVRQYIKKVKAPKIPVDESPTVFKKVKYEEAKQMAWQIIIEKLGGKPSNFSKEGNIVEVLPQLIRYFIGDSESVYPLHKGIYLWGDTGCGKSFLMETMQTLTKELGIQNHFFQIQNSSQLTEKILNLGLFEPDKYLKQASVFEDLGQETPCLRIFSNDIRPMHSIINRAYDNYKKNGQLIHFTSMLPPHLLHETNDSSLSHFDRRTYERICEMTTSVKLTGTSKRIF